MNINELKFPYYRTDDAFRKDLLDQFNAKLQWGDSIFSYSEATKEFTFKQNTLGITYLWTFFNALWATIRCGKAKTLMEVFEDKILLEELLKKYNLFNKTNISDAKLREILKIPLGVQFVSNFRPTSAYAIYDIFLEDSDNATVWDPCAGFGGRLLGAVKAEKVKTYIGCEPSIQAYMGLSQLKTNLDKNDRIYTTNIDLYNERMENLKLEDNSIDMVFTSPPYFNLEEYSYDDTQSFVKYKDYESWLSGFMETLCDKAYRCLKPNKKFILNINAIPEHKDLHYASLNIALNRGFKLVAIHKYLISSKNKSVAGRFEPIFELEKPGN